MIKHLILTVASLTVLAAGLAAQEGPRRLEISTDGPIPSSTPTLENPAALLRMPAVRALAFEMRRAPRDSAYVAEALAGVDVSVENLVDTELIRRQGGEYELGFPLLTTEDIHTLMEVSERFAETLADRYLARRAEIEAILDRYPLLRVDRPTLAFVILGCASLDWDGLDITEEAGYRTPFKREGVGRVHWAKERQPSSLDRGLYWGSHSQTLGDVTLTSFGDHAKIFRFAFPDLYWRLAQGFPQVLGQLARNYDVEVPDALTPAIRGVGNGLFRSLAVRTAAVMMPLREGPKTAEELTAAAGIETDAAERLLALLEALEYVEPTDEGYVAAVPVFSAADRAMTQELMELSHEIMVEWLADNYEPLERALAERTPVGGPVSFEDTFYYVWHYVFGTANRILVERGLFTDPYADGRRYKGYVAFVWEEGVLELGQG